MIRTEKYFLCLGFILTYVVSSLSQVFPTHNLNPHWNFLQDDYTFQIPRGEIFTTTPITLPDGVNWIPIRNVTFWSEAPDIIPIPNDTVTVGYYSVQGDQVYYSSGTNPILNNSYGLLYDFSANVGDEVIVVPPAIYFPDSLVTYNVQAVDTIYCNGELLRSLTVVFEYDEPDWSYVYYETKWVEGVGDIYHPFPITSCVDVMPACEIEYSDMSLTTDNLYWDLTDDSSCPISVDVVDQVSLQTYQLIVAPNPTTNAIRLAIDERATLEIFNSQGKLVLKSEYSPGNFINITDFFSGLYFIKAYLPDRVLTGHVVVMK